MTHGLHGLMAFGAIGILRWYGKACSGIPKGLRIFFSLGYCLITYHHDLKLVVLPYRYILEPVVQMRMLLSPAGEFQCPQFVRIIRTTGGSPQHISLLKFEVHARSSHKATPLSYFGKSLTGAQKLHVHGPRPNNFVLNIRH